MLGLGYLFRGSYIKEMASRSLSLGTLLFRTDRWPGNADGVKMVGSNHNRTLSTDPSALVGWTLESTGRGTLTLLASCMVTTALCTWIIIHPRIYKRKKHRFPHKLALWLKTIVAPEFIAVEAAQEWTQAQKIIKQSSRSTNGELHLVQAFYIGMFGLQYRTPLGTRVLWPNQFIWLLDQGLLNWRQHQDWGLSREIIEDKGNSDATAKLLTLVQVAWFVAQSIMRVAHNLPLAPLEVMTLSYIPLFGVAYFYWWMKPKDIGTPSEIHLPNMSAEEEATFHSLAIHDRFDNEGTAAQESIWSVWALTPRMFEKEAADRAFEGEQQERMVRKGEFEHHIEVCSSTDCTDTRHLGPTTPLQRRKTALTHWDPELYHSKIMWPVCCLAGVSFPALHLISWQSAFPTLVETWLWRASTIASMVSMLVFMQFEKLVIGMRDPLTIVKIFLPALYIVTRVVLLGGAIAAFRAMDPAVYNTYVASSYWLHIM